MALNTPSGVTQAAVEPGLSATPAAPSGVTAPGSATQKREGAQNTPRLSFWREREGRGDTKALGLPPDPGSRELRGQSRGHRGRTSWKSLCPQGRQLPRPADQTSGAKGSEGRRPVPARARRDTGRETAASPAWCPRVSPRHHGKLKPGSPAASGATSECRGAPGCQWRERPCSRGRWAPRPLEESDREGRGPPDLPEAMPRVPLGVCQMCLGGRAGEQGAATLERHRPRPHPLPCCPVLLSNFHDKKEVQVIRSGRRCPRFLSL